MAKQASNTGKNPGPTTNHGAPPARGVANGFPQAASGARPGGTAESKPDQERVRKRAYELFLERQAKNGAGDAATDWLRAEAELSRP